MEDSRCRQSYGIRHDPSRLSKRGEIIFARTTEVPSGAHTYVEQNACA
jgi:hypothetical protein